VRKENVRSGWIPVGKAVSAKPPYRGKRQGWLSEPTGRRARQNLLRVRKENAGATGFLRDKAVLAKPPYRGKSGKRLSARQSSIFHHGMVKRRKLLPHEPPLHVDPNREIWFLTLCCAKRGRNSLAHQPVADQLLRSVRHRMNAGQWYPHLWLLMPDHLHALVSFSEEVRMKATVAAWKRWTARNLGIPWQRDFFDHRLRRDESYQEKYEYILQNPVRAGLVHRVEDWPFVMFGSDAFSRNDGMKNAGSVGSARRADREEGPPESAAGA